MMLPASAGSGSLHTHVSYEEILKKVGRQETLETAIQRCEEGWIPQEIPEVTDNFQAYSSLVAKYFSGLKMKTKPSNKPTQSRTIYFDEVHSGISGNAWPKVILNHQWKEGRVKVLFKGWGEYRDALEPIVREDLCGTPYSIDPNKTKSFGIMIKVPEIDNHANANEQLEKMRQGLSAAEKLHLFIKQNHAMVQRWAIIVTG